MINQKRAGNNKKLGQSQTGFEETFLNGSGPGLMLRTPTRRYRRIYTPLVMLWCLIYQRLNTDHRCDAVVSHVRSGGADHLETDEKKARLSERCRSESSAGFCKARQRMPLDWLEQALTYVVQLARQYQKVTQAEEERLIHLIDGSTVLVRPEPGLVKHYGQHKTIKKCSYWVVVRIVVLLCLRNGMVESLEEGCQTQSELKLAVPCILRQPANGIYIADRGFGVFSLVQAVRHASGDVVVRLSRLRARKLFASQFYPGTEQQVTWVHSERDHLNPGMSTAPILGRLIYVRLERPGFRSQDLYLFTSLLDQQVYPRQKLIELYGLRWHVELDLRYIKRTLDLFLLEGKSVDVVRKELLAGALAYNLIRMFMVLAAHKAGLSPLRLSFTRIRRRICSFLFTQTFDKRTVVPDLSYLIDRLAQCRLAILPQPRLEPRWVRPRDKSFLEFWDTRHDARLRYSASRSASAVC